MTNSTPLLEINDLSLSFTSYAQGLRQISTQVLKNLSLKLHAGEVFTIVGSSGSGKSLLAETILDILPKNAHVTGSIKLDGAPATCAALRKMRGRELLYVPQGVTNLDPLMKVGHQVCLRPEQKQYQEAAFKRLELSDAVTKLYPFELSGGMARRTLVSTALLGTPRMVIADEPTPGMTLDQARETLQLFRDMADKGAGVIVITHDLTLALEISDTIGVFYDGTIIEQAQKSQFTGLGEQLKQPFTRALWCALPQNEFSTPEHAGAAGVATSNASPAGQPESQRVEANSQVTPGNEPENAHDAAATQASEHAGATSNTPPASQPESAPAKDAAQHAAQHASVLEAKNVSFCYPGSKHCVLENINLEVHEGEIVGLFGGSGHGKSTLARVLAGQLPIKQGSITFDGQALNPHSCSPVQLIFQHPELALNPRWRMKRTLQEAWDVPQSLLDKAGIRDEWKERYPFELSGGELQRFCVVRALAPTTKILLCDEISTMLDAITQAHIWHLLLDHAKEHSMGMLVISHSEALLNRICTRIMSIDALNNHANCIEDQ